MGDSSFKSGFKTGFGSAFLQVVLDRFATFGSYAWKEIQLIWNVEDELKKLERTFSKVQDLLNHVDGNPLRFSGGSKAWQIWFENLTRLAYDADSLLDHIALHLTSCSATQESQVRSNILSSFKSWDIPREISEMQNKLENVAREIKGLLKIENVNNVTKIGLPHFSNFCSTSSLMEDEIIIGRGNDEMRVLAFLNRNNEEGNFSVISLVGMGGIGKTTLARLVYNNNEINNNFERKIWVSVSNFDAFEITKSIIEAATGQACFLSKLNSAQLCLQETLGDGGKFLLVLDDYWSENHNDWNVLSLPFRHGSRGSKVIVTTRSTKVSLIVNSNITHNLEQLSDDDCWTLMRQRVFPRVEAQEDLGCIGREIARKCKGLPLAAKTMGSLLLHCRPTKDDWHSILECNLWDLPREKNDVFPALMLSYFHLSAHLRKCFAYCSLFPKGHEFEVEELVLLWMAEGFIQPIKGRRLEDLGSDYFYDLCSRSFFQQATNPTGQIIYRMHDLIHDMAQLVSADICLQVNYSVLNDDPLFGNTCHLSLIRDQPQPQPQPQQQQQPPQPQPQPQYLKASQKNERLRTFLLISNNPPTGQVPAEAEVQVSPALFTHLKFLRVLDLRCIGLTNLPDSIDHLKYLRYLNLSGNHRIVCLPESMCKLVALQTLKLENCHLLRELPKNTKNLSNLRHLELNIRGQLSQMPPHFGKLTSLQSLSAFIVTEGEGNGIDELKNMNFLTGSLCITDIKNVLEASNAAEANLGKKSRLDKLELQWGVSSSEENSRHQESILENLQPPVNLKELVIQSYFGTCYPHWFHDRNLKFKSVHLEGLKNCNHLPPLGQLPFLEAFHISGMDNLEHIDQSFYGGGDNVKFPLLKSFRVHNMDALIDWKNEDDDAMPHLESPTFEDCRSLRRLPQKFHELTGSNITNCPNLPQRP